MLICNWKNQDFPTLVADFLSDLLPENNENRNFMLLLLFFNWSPYRLKTN